MKSTIRVEKHYEKSLSSSECFIDLAENACRSSTESTAKDLETTILASKSTVIDEIGENEVIVKDIHSKIEFDVSNDIKKKEIHALQVLYEYFDTPNVIIRL